MSSPSLNVIFILFNLFITNVACIPDFCCLEEVLLQHAV